MDFVSVDDLKQLSGKRSEWCVSIYLPTHRESQEKQQDPVRLKNLIKDAEDALLSYNVRAPLARDLLAPARSLIENYPFWEYQSDGLAVFIAPDLFRYYRIPLHFEEEMVINSRFFLKPLIPEVLHRNRFYILAFSQHSIRLFEADRLTLNEIELEDVPKSVEEALWMDTREEHQQFHTNTATPGGKGGERPAIWFGHGGEKDVSKENILLFAQQVDKGLHEVIEGNTIPMVFAGVDYLFPIYQEANTYPYLLDEHIEGNFDRSSGQTLKDLAWNMIQPRFEKDIKDAADLYMQWAHTKRASSDIKEIVPAAFYGRVASLFVPLGMDRWGKFNPDTAEVHVHDQPEKGDEDLYDLAAIHTLINNGNVYAVEPQEIPGGELVAAQYRYEM